MVKPAVPFNPTKDIPSLAGQVILITGGTDGIGKQCVLEYAAHSPAQLWFSGRSATKGAAVASEAEKRIPAASASTPSGKTQVHFLEMDLASFDSIKAAARKFLAAVASESPSSPNRLDILMLNAGIMGGPTIATPQGHELRFGTNHVGHALLLRLLFPLLQSTQATPGGDVRILSLSSEGHRNVPKEGIDFAMVETDGSSTVTVTRYCQSKLANAVYAAELARRYPDLLSVSISPGNVKTGLFTPNGGGWSVMVLRTFIVPFVGRGVEEGAKCQLWASVVDRKELENGAYYEAVGVGGTGSELAKSEELGRKLWEWTERQLEGHTTL